MSNNKPTLDRLINDLFSTGHDEIYCDQATDLMALAAAVDLSEEANQDRFRHLIKHLQFCNNCREEFELVQQVALDTSSINVIEIPNVPNNGRFPILEAVQNILTIQFPGFTPMLGQALTRGEELGFEPTAVSLPNTSVTLEIDVGVSEENQSHRDIFITLLNDEATASFGEGSSIWLHQETSGPVIQEQAFDELGDLSFTNLQPGSYALLLNINNQHYAISPITLP